MMPTPEALEILQWVADMSPIERHRACTVTCREFAGLVYKMWTTLCCSHQGAFILDKAPQRSPKSP